MDWETKLKSSSWKSLNISHYDQFTYLLCLIYLILTISTSTTAGFERGFSVIKSQRTNLATSTLSDLMCELLESCDIDEYDPSKACGPWAEEIVRNSLYSSRIKTAKSFSKNNVLL